MYVYVCINVLVNVMLAYCIFIFVFLYCRKHYTKYNFMIIIIIIMNLHGNKTNATDKYIYNTIENKRLFHLSAIAEQIRFKKRHHDQNTVIQLA